MERLVDLSLDHWVCFVSCTSSSDTLGPLLLRQLTLHGRLNHLRVDAQASTLPLPLPVASASEARGSWIMVANGAILYRRQRRSVDAIPAL